MKKILYSLFILFLVLNAGSVAAFELMGERTPLFEKRHYKSWTGDAAMDYYLLKPVNYDARRKYSLVLTLHGASGHSWAAYILSFPQMQQAYPAFVLVPRAQVGSWENAAYEDLRPEPTKHIMSIIKSLEKEFSIDPERIYVTGYSMGGYGTFGIIAQYPHSFAAAAPLCGGGEIKDAGKMVGTPTWAFHGALDNNIPVNQSRLITKAIKQAGSNQIYYTEYPKLGHNVWNTVYHSPQFWNWMFNQRRKQSQTSLLNQLFN
jgi:predicted peptidase